MNKNNNNKPFTKNILTKKNRDHNCACINSKN